MSSVETADSLADAARRGDRTEFAAEMRRSPGGRYLVDHLYDGPFHLLFLGEDLTDPHYQTYAALTAFPPVRIPANVSGEDLDVVHVAAVPQLAYEVVGWYSDGNRGCFPEEFLEDVTYDQMPTDRDLAAALPAILGLKVADIAPYQTPGSEEFTRFEDLEAFFTQAFDQVGFPAIMRLLDTLAPKTCQEAVRIIPALRGILAAPAH